MERRAQDRIAAGHLQDGAPEPSRLLAEMATPTSQARCIECGRRLLDYCNAVRSGQIIIHKVCERCKKMNVFTLGPG